MTLPPIQPGIEASDIPTERLAGSSMLTEDQKIGEATRQFEALLLRQILESTQKTVIQSKYSDNSTTAGIYRDMVTNQLAESISKSGTLGLAQTLKREFTRQVKAERTADGPANVTAPAAQENPNPAFRQLESQSQTAVTDARKIYQSPKYSTPFSNPATPIQVTQP
jgi:flagellar protein FlgJ